MIWDICVPDIPILASAHGVELEVRRDDNEVTLN